MLILVKILTTAIARLLLAKPPCFCVVILIVSVTCIWNMIKKIIWCDWFICEITCAAREYKKNIRGREEEQNCYLKFENERGFLHCAR